LIDISSTADLYIFDTSLCCSSDILLTSFLVSFAILSYDVVI